jgi:septum formation protein
MEQLREQPRQLVLASTSKYRKALLERLRLDFSAAAPGIVEHTLSGEAPADTALRLSMLKAHSLHEQFPDALIVGSDQVAAAGNMRLDKPGHHANAVRQLRHLSGKSADFHTAVTLLDARNGSTESTVVACRVTFRNLDDTRIEAYLRRERPYDCAGSAKAEGLGIALIARMETEDPTSLIGLPLIALTGMLERAGLPVL